MNEKEILNGLNTIPSGNKIYLYGCGELARRTIAVLEQERKDIIVLGCLDSYKSASFEGLEVISVDEFQKEPRQYDLILITSVYWIEMKKTLEYLGISQFKILQTLKEETGRVKGDFSVMAIKDLEVSMKRFGRKESWEGEFKYGYRWDEHDRLQKYYEVGRLLEKVFFPFLKKQEIDILEIAPGGGRATVELLRVADSLTLVDFSPGCIEVCKERFKYYEHMKYFVNNGYSLDMIEEHSLDLIFSFDSLVHVDKELVECYVSQFPAKLRPGGMAWIHHAACGITGFGGRSNMTADLMKGYARKYGLLVTAQIGHYLLKEPYPHFNDVITIMEVPE